MAWQHGDLHAVVEAPNKFCNHRALRGRRAVSRLAVSSSSEAPALASSGGSMGTANMRDQLLPVFVIIVPAP